MLKDSAMAEWYELDPITGVMTHTPLDNGEVWHLDKWVCFMLAAGEDHTKPNSIESSPIRNLYIIAECDENGEKIKLTLEMIHIDNKDMCPIEQYGPAFIKRNKNGQLYKSQIFRSCTNSIKENIWERDYGVDLKEICKTHLNTFAHSKVKGFMWLFTSHALPVGTRLCCKETNNRCPHCMEVEDIKHMAFDGIVAKNIRDMVFMEWWTGTTESWWLNHPKFEEAFFNKGTSTFEVLRRTLNDIATYHFWRYRCNILYRGEITPTVVPGTPVSLETLNNLSLYKNNGHKRGQGYSLPPIFPTFDPN
jgi:hypothetical protein